MKTDEIRRAISEAPKLTHLSAPLKTLITAMVLTLSLAMVGAMGQIIVHDIIPTFEEGKATVEQAPAPTPAPDSSDIHKGMHLMSDHGDLFATAAAPAQPQAQLPFHKTEQFVWILKWTHIHIFSMNMIFFFMGAITCMLSLPPRIRVLLVAMPFVGVLTDITAVWLKTYVSPLFFWLHVPAGSLFGGIFAFVALRALWEMWIHRE